MTPLAWLFRGYLLAGLVFHKALWEYMKRRQRGPAAPKPALPFKTRLIKLVKLAILLGIVAQTMVPDSVMARFGLLISADPTALQVTGFCLYTLGLLIAVLGRTQLGGNWSDIETAEVLTKQRVVSHGVYRFIRHPIYTGDLLLLYGLELALNSWLIIGVVLLTPIVLRQAVKEEDMLRQELDGYDEYCTMTKRFIPFIA